MVKTAMELGIKHPLVLLLSKKIDKLHTELTEINLRKLYTKKKVENDKIFEHNWQQQHA